LIHPERFDGGTPYGSQANNEREVIAPGEMLRPALLAGVKEANALGSQWLCTLDFIIFVTVACWAGEGEVRQCGFATF
jgi:hypothetical protein